MQPKRPALGRGLDSLIAMDDAPARGTSAINDIEISRISPNPDQPRRLSTKRPLRNSRAPSANLASYSPCRCAKPDLTLIRSLPVSDVTARR